MMCNPSPLHPLLAHLTPEVQLRWGQTAYDPKPKPNVTYALFPISIELQGFFHIVSL